jgi:hypothetical protein
LLCFYRSLIKLSLRRHWLVNKITGAVIRSFLFLIKRLFFGELRTPQSPSVRVVQFSHSGTKALSFSVSVSHNYTHTVGRTPLNERTAHCRGRYMHNIQQVQETTLHVLSGIRTHGPNNQATAHLRLRPYCYQDRQSSPYSGFDTR